MNTDTNAGSSLISGRTCALMLGLIFIVLGIAGFIPGLVSLPGAAAPLTGDDMPLTAGTDYAAGFVRGFGYLFGIFPTNTLHNTLHLALGGFGLYSAWGDRGSYNYSRFCAIFLPIVALLGIIPATNSLFGAMPISGGNVWLNLVTGAIALYATLTSRKPSGEPQV